MRRFEVLQRGGQEVGLVEPRLIDKSLPEQPPQRRYCRLRRVRATEDLRRRDSAACTGAPTPTKAPALR